MTPPLITFPARPVNGGRLENAPSKVGPWIVQPKVKDWRAIIHAPTRRIWNRHGQPMSIADNLADVLEILRFSSFDWLDVGVMERQNQLLRNSIIVFDTIDPELAHFTHENRRAHLEIAFETLPDAIDLKPSRNRVFLINEYCTERPDGPLVIYHALQNQNVALGGNPHDDTDMKNFYEGIVCKRTDKPYPIQLLSPEKTTPWMIKHRFDQ